MRNDGLAQARLLALLLPLALMAGALGSQFIGGLYPCEMCQWQRWPHYAAILVAALAFVVRPRAAAFTFVAFAAILIAVSGGIGLFHAGVEYHWWPGITPCTATADPNLSADEMLAAVLDGPMIRCDAPQWTLFGISLAGYNAIFSLGGAVAVFALLARRPRR